MAELRFEKGFLKGKTIQIPAGRYLVVGRAKEAGLPLPDPQLSRRHCKLTHSVDGILLEDLGSRNGTYVNGQAITTVKLRHGDQIHFGDQVAQYDHPKGLMDSSGDYESEEGEATREIPELQPGQAMLLNPPKIVRGPDSAPPPKPPTQIAQEAGSPPPILMGGLLPPSQALEDEAEAELPQIDQAMPMPPGLEDAIEADLSAPLPDLPPNPISMEETMVKPQRPQVDPAKAPPPKSKIKKLMESYKAEVMASTIDEVKPVPKIKPASSLKGGSESGGSSKVVIPAGAGSRSGAKARADSAAAAGENEAPVLRPVTRPDIGREAESETEHLSAAPEIENEAQIEQVLEAADRQMRPGAAPAPAAHPKTIPLSRDLTAAEEAAAAKRASQLADSFAEDLLDRELGEAAEVIEAEAAEAGPFAAEDGPTTPAHEWRPDETGEIDPEAIKGAGGEIAIDTSRIDRHREIADEIFRAAQSDEEIAAEAEAEAQAEAEELIEEVDEDFDLDSLEQVAAPTLDLVKLDKTETPVAESSTGIEVLEDGAPPPPPAVKPATGSAATGGSPVKPGVSGRKMTPPPTLPPILVDEHLDCLGLNEDYAHCAGLWAKSKASTTRTEGNLLAPILAKNDEYQQLLD